MLVYVDTCVFLNYWLDEYGKHVEQYFSHYANEFFKKVLDCKYEIVISNFVVKEVSKVLRISEHEAIPYFDEFTSSGKLEIHKVSERQAEFAYELQNKKGLHFGDAIHAAVAVDHGAPIVTRNIKDFVKVKNIAKAYRPEQM